LPNNKVTTIAIDDFGNKWIGTDNGLAKYDDLNWTVYNKSNSGLPTNNIRCIAIDKKGAKWIGNFYGLVKYDDSVWTVFNSNLLSNKILSIAVDRHNNKWIGTDKGLMVYCEEGVILQVEEIKRQEPLCFELYQNYPNPFNPSTIIKFGLKEKKLVNIKIYDLLGREIVELLNEEKERGIYEIEFNAGKYGLSGGVYFYKMKAGENIAIKKMLLLK